MWLLASKNIGGAERAGKGQGREACVLLDKFVFCAPGDVKRFLAEDLQEGRQSLELGNVLFLLCIFCEADCGISQLCNIL